MAKQSGIHQLKGKVRDMSYYRQKGVADGLARSINQGLSKRVKEDAAYANTRLNASEFGTAGAFAGACIRNISERQRAMLKDFATGDFAKFVKSIIINDANNPWGERSIGTIGAGSLLHDKLNTYAKNDFEYSVGGVWDVEVTTGGTNNSWAPNAELPSGWGGVLAAKGATGAYVDMYAYNVSIIADGKAPFKSESKLQVLASETATIGQSVTITNAVDVPVAFEVEDFDNEFTATLVVVRPYREVNGKMYIMQELCTFKLFKPALAQ
jgi:hypothetical protein